MKQTKKPIQRERDALNAILRLTRENRTLIDRFFTPKEIHYAMGEDRKYNAKDINHCISGIRWDYVSRAVIVQGSRIVRGYRANLEKSADIEAEIRLSNF